MGFGLYYFSNKEYKPLSKEQLLVEGDGVFDASEGREWCGYSKALPDTLRENVYSFFQHLPEKRLQERASSLIIESLKKTLPCDKKR